MPLICFASPKGGVGKTTLAANIAGHLAARGLRVIALDLDPQNALGLHFGQDLACPDGLAAALGPEPDASGWRARIRNTHSDVMLLPFGRLTAEAILQRDLALASRPELLTTPVNDMLADPATVVVADTSPGLSMSLLTLLPLASLVCTVLLADAASLAMTPTIESGACYGSYGSRVIALGRMGIVLNQWDSRSRFGRVAGQAARRHFGKGLLGVVYRDEHVPEAVAAQRLVVDHAPESKAAHDMSALADAIAARLGLGAAHQPALAAARGR